MCHHSTVGSAESRSMTGVKLPPYVQHICASVLGHLHDRAQFACQFVTVCVLAVRDSSLPTKHLLEQKTEEKVS